MNKLIWIRIAAVAMLFVAVLALYFMFKADHVVRSYHDETLVQISIPNVTASQTPQISQPPPRQTANVVKPPFNASSYEVNYTLVFTVSLSGVTVTMEGWMVVGTGLAGNYSFGMLTIPLRGTATFKSATEGNVTYTLTCANGYCTVREEKWPLSELVEGVNATRTAKGRCERLGYAGVLYEEKGILDPRTFSGLFDGFDGNYTAYVCEVSEVMLSIDFTATATIRNELIRVTLKMETVKARPYSPETYCQILQEIKAAGR